MTTFQRIAKIVNKAVVPLLDAPVVRSRLARSVAIVTYVGRRSGKTFSTPVNYTTKKDGSLVIGVLAADQKSWWRNFYPEAHPITVTIGGESRSGMAVAQRDPKLGTRVKVTFND